MDRTVSVKLPCYTACKRLQSLSDATVLNGAIRIKCRIRLGDEESDSIAGGMRTGLHNFGCSEVCCPRCCSCTETYSVLRIQVALVRRSAENTPATPEAMHKVRRTYSDTTKYKRKDKAMPHAPSQTELAPYFAFGNSLIARTRELILSLWSKASISSELKADDTPVSEVDLRCEELVREAIRKQFPTHGIVGEEMGFENESAEFVWTIDPIDGTQNLINRIPTFGTMLALLFQGRPVLGWIDHPVLGEMICGGRHLGTLHNGRIVKLPDLKTGRLTSNDVIGINNPATFQYGGHLEVLWKVLNYHQHVRMYYDVYSHSLTVLGSLAAHVEYNLKVWDYAASQALVEGAGGAYRELGQSDYTGKAKLYHAIFGKPRAVEMISEAILNQK